ncbi:fatty acid desaturase [Rhodobacter sp. Har01]|uniref:fatty acid desaturase n=1 Tax=Rhodobacter sp. Har01 TaxID=2883999 RepID=UPI0029CA415B|nr:fatty acid desaturase [Rhodobacter sp. Har01]
MRIETPQAEWPTIYILAGTYVVWALATSVLWAAWPVAFILVALAVAQHSSLQHEALHGHPTQNETLNHLLVFPAIGLFIPYLRFRDTHLKHHYDPALTDPYEDPESNFLDPAVWESLSPRQQSLMRFNNTLAGRMLVGPAISYYAFVKADLAEIRGGNDRIALAWALHGIGVMLALLWIVGFGAMPVWAWVLASYFGASLLKIRTFLEHRAHEKFRARTVIVEDKGPLSYLFLNNNLHVVHHMHPKASWYKLPAMYAAKRDHYQRRNEAYVFKSYSEIFSKYFMTAKDPVPHPIWPVDKSGADPGEMIDDTLPVAPTPAPAPAPAAAAAPASGMAAEMSDDGIVVDVEDAEVIAPDDATPPETRKGRKGK